MANRNQEPIRRKDTIRCEFCGEDYAVSYKRCPFCDEKPSRSGGGDSDRGGSSGSRTASGGKRLVTNRRGGGYGGGMEPVQIIGLALSIILIIAALYIVFIVVKPLFSPKTPPGSNSSNPGSSTSQPNNPGSQGGSQGDPGGSTSDPGGSTSDPGITPPPVTTDPVDPPASSGVTGITLTNCNKGDFTLEPPGDPYDHHQIKFILTPAGATGTVTWTSSNTDAAAVAQDGTVTNVNKGRSQVTVTITASIGDAKATCIVRCKPASSGGGTTTTDPSTPGGTALPSGTTGTVINTTTGLFVRSGPGRNYEAQATLLNGTPVTLLEDTGTGWYRISYAGAGGAATTGYVSKDYIQVN